MTVITETPIASSVANGVTTVFSHAFTVLQAADLVVKGELAGVVSTYTLGVHYTVSGLGGGSGSITFLAPPANGTIVTRYRDSALQRTTDYQDNGDLLADTLNLDFDRLWLLLQEIFAGGKGSPSSLRVPGGETIAPLPAKSGRALRVLAFDSNGDPLMLVGVDASSAAALQIDLAEAANPAKGSALVGYGAGVAYPASSIGAAIAQLADVRGQYQLDGVNVLRYIPPAEWAAIIAGTSTTDLYAYLQAALTAEPNLIFPDGLYNTGTKLVPRVDAKLRGINRRGARIKGTTPLTIIEFQYGTFDPVVENIRFMGVGCTGIGVAAPAGALQGYLIRPHVTHCDFDYDLAFGINADLIFAAIDHSTFGYYGVGSLPAPGSSGLVSIRSFSYPATANFTNLNTVRNCIFQRSGGAAVPGIDISGGSSWLFDASDWEHGGVVLRAANIQLLKFTGNNWIEGNVATNALITIGACTTPVRMEGVQIANNTCDRIIEAPLDGTCKGLAITGCEISKSGSSFCIFDTISLARTLPGNGSVAFYDNHVTGGAAGDKCVTGTDFRGGKASPRFTMCGDTSGSGSITDSSDPGLLISRNGVGDVSITASHPIASATNKIRAVAGNQIANAVRVLLINQAQVRVQLTNDAGAAVDGAFSLVCYGG